MRLDENGRVVMERAELEVLARAARVGLRDLRRDRVPQPVLERALYDSALLLGQLGATVACSVTAITDAPSRRVWVRCVECDRSTDRPRRRRCEACYKRGLRRGDFAGDAAALGA